MQPLLVQMRSHSLFERPDLYVDSQPVAWEDFDKVLRSELNRRPPDWPVYLEGDPDAEWGHVGNAIDKIRGLRAEVVLLTPKAALPRAQSGSKTTPGRADAHGVGKR
jgi:biopolymer transport protein ExbD